MPSGKKPTVYLTFDDGPHPIATPFILEQLRKYEIKATFFCVGKNVVKYPDIYKSILEEGHTVGNHTHSHLKGWVTTTEDYLLNIYKAAQHIDSRLFRPPYGRIRQRQIRKLFADELDWKIYMWDVLSGDFDKNITPEECFQNVKRYTTPGSIIVFHDSEKAWERLQYALPEALEYFNSKNWNCNALQQE